MSNEGWLIAGPLLAFVGVLAQSYAIATLGLLLLTVLLVAKLWARLSLHGVRYERTLSSERVYAGESVSLEVHLTNPKPLALAWLRIEDRLDSHLVLRDLDKTLRAEAFAVTNTGREWEIRRQVSVGWYQRLILRYNLECPRRGYHQIGPATLASGDPFGLYTREERLGESAGVLVYPKLVPVERLGLPRHFPFEGTRTGAGLLDDPLNITGARPYAEGDTLRQVHWRASARSAGLQSKVWRPTTEPGVLIFLDLASNEFAWQGVDAEAVELAVSTAATVAHRVHDARRALGLHVNGLRSGTRQKIQIGLSRGDQAFALVMDTLARVYPYPNQPLAELLRSERHRLPTGATLVVVTAVRLPSVDQQVESLRRSGHHVLLLDVGAPGRVREEAPSWVPR